MRILGFPLLPRPLPLALLIALPLLVTTTAAPACALQEAAQTDQAQELWERVCASTFLRSKADAKPITALDLQFEVLTRGDQGSTEIKPRVRWLDPGFIRIQLSSGREVGRGPKGDWLREGNEVVRMVGREYAQDRRDFDSYLTIINIFVALTHPKTLAVENLSIVSELPFDFPKRHDLNKTRDRKRLKWLRFESQDLQLSGSDDWGDTVPKKQTVHVAIDTANHLPVMAHIADKSGELAPMLLSLADSKALQDLRIPHKIFVYPIIAGPASEKFRPTLTTLPSQQLHLLGGTVRALFKASEFDAKE